MSYFLQMIVLGVQRGLLICLALWTINDGIQRMRAGGWSFLLNVGGLAVVVLLLRSSYAAPPCDCACGECVEEHG